MDLLSNLFILPVLLIALGTINIVSRFIKIDTNQHRYSAIDGTRGYLAMFVFLHHAGSWWYMLHSHMWGIIPNRLYNHFGSVAVSFFFMITSFLFITKLIETSETRTTRFDWPKLYVSRVMRIMPLYTFAMVGLFLSVCFASCFILHESLQQLMQHIGQWFLFMEPDINNVKGTKFFISGVQWSLACEWLFYCSLVIIGKLFFRLRASLATLLLTLVFVSLFIYIIYDFYPLRNWVRATPFIAGVAAAFLVRKEPIRKLFTNSWFTLILVLLLSISLSGYKTMFELVPFCCISAIFIAVASGNDFFGVLTGKASRRLGQISYSLYLLHALILSTVFHFILPAAPTYSVLQFWLVIVVCSAVVTTICSLTYVYVEKPWLDKAPDITRCLRHMFNRPSKLKPTPIETGSVFSPPDEASVHDSTGNRTSE